MIDAAPLVTALFRSRNLTFHLNPEGDCAELCLSAPSGDWMSLVRWGADGGDLVQFTSQFPFRVPPARRAEFGLLLHELNDVYVRGKLTLLPGCGTVGLRTGISLLRGASPHCSLEKGFDEHCITVASLLAPLAAAAFGSDCPLKLVKFVAGNLPASEAGRQTYAGRN